MGGYPLPKGHKQGPRPAALFSGRLSRMSKTPEEKYILQRKLGDSRAGETWLATDAFQNRPVVVKFLPIVSAAQKEEVIAEAQKLISLNHPNLVEVYDSGFDEDNQKPYLVTEYVQGTPLSHLITKDMPLRTILEVSLGILYALQYLHNQGIIYHNLKPDNILLLVNRSAELEQLQAIWADIQQTARAAEYWCQKAVELLSDIDENEASMAGAHFLAQLGRREQAVALEQEARAEAARIGLFL